MRGANFRRRQRMQFHLARLLESRAGGTQFIGAHAGMAHEFRSSFRQRANYFDEIAGAKASR